jgi:hypothetical protein
MYENKLLAYFPYLNNIKVGLWDHHAIHYNLINFYKPTSSLAASLQNYCRPYISRSHAYTSPACIIFLDFINLKTAGEEREK